MLTDWNRSRILAPRYHHKNQHYHLLRKVVLHNLGAVAVVYMDSCCTYQRFGQRFNVSSFRSVH